MFGGFKYDCFYDENTCILEWWNRGIGLMKRLVVEKKKCSLSLIYRYIVTDKLFGG